MTITKPLAWNSLPKSEEKWIPLDTSQYQFQFTRRWFRNRNQCTWSSFLAPKFDGSKPVRMIQIGVFEGMDLVWDLQNILKHPDSRVLAIDPWLETTKLDQDIMDGVQARARHNLSPWRKKVKIVQGTSHDVLSQVIQEGVEIGGVGILPGQFDLIVIDGDHNAPAVYDDAILSLQLVKVGGWLLFDDVRNDKTKKNHVQEGLNAFVRDFGDQVNLAWFHRYCDCYEKIKEPEDRP